jgi:hypothetical protein
MNRALPLLGLSALVALACNKDGPTPAYMELRPPVVIGDNGQEVTSKITDAWVYVNNQPAGVWEPGKRIPLLASGTNAVKIIAGVRKDGFVDNRIQYPFYATWEQSVNLVPDQTIAVEPQVHYFSGLTYWLSDMNTGQRFDTLDCTATMTLVPSDSTLTGQGIANGRISLDADHSFYKGVSSGDPFTVPDHIAFLEMDYRSDTPLLIGVRYTLAGVQYEAPIVYVKATGSVNGLMPWNKVYIDLGTPWNVSGAQDRRFFLQAGLADGASTGRVDLDNVKVVTH